MESDKVNMNSDPNRVELVDWDGEDDPENPQNWPTLWKWGNIGLISMITIIT
jgi:hypothetical protein